MGEQDTIYDLGFLDDAGTAFRRYAEGERIFVTDEDGDCMYVVRAGTVEIRHYGTVLDKIGPGGIFGEIAIIDGGARAATAVALTDCEVAPITRAGFLSLVRQQPEFALQVMKALARRIRGMNEST